MKPLMSMLLLLPALVHAADILDTGAYRWHGDTITQGEYMATAPSAHEIVSTYHAQPGYVFPVGSRWVLRNDISCYPQLKTPSVLHSAIYNMGLDEMVNAVEPDTTLRTGKEWAGVWTRDVSYSILLSMAYMQPEASMVSLMRKVDKEGRIVQDTGTGGAWPVSTDRMVWALAAYEVYKVTGDRLWLEKIYPIIRKSLEDDSATTSCESGLVKGETSFIDWREQSYPRWMQPADIYASEALNTSAVHCRALRVLAAIASELGHNDVALESNAKADAIASAINEKLWMADKGYYAMYRYGRHFPILNPRAETLGESLAILFDIADNDRARQITENNPTTPFGTAIFYPQIADMTSYHNNALWPWVGSCWALANAKVGNEQGVLEAIGAVFRPAALFATNKENFVLDNGDIATELNSSNMLWSLAGNIAITHKILFGIHFAEDSLHFRPFVPKALAAERTLEGFPYRGAILDITVRGYGGHIKSFKLNGKEHAPSIPATLTGRNTVDVTMADEESAQMKVNHVRNAKAPLTPIAWLEGKLLKWNPIEYSAGYIVVRDGERIARTRRTEFDASIPGEYAVIALASDGTESFISEPRSNRDVISIQMPGGTAELSRNTPPVTMNIDIPSDGTYAIAVCYANGSGPVNTENKCALRSLSVDGERKGIIVMPQRGKDNWEERGMSPSVAVPLTAGKHTLTIDFRQDNENMNISVNNAYIDSISLTRLF